MQGIVNSGSFSAALWPGLNAWFQGDYMEWPDEYTQLFDVQTSTKQFEEDQGMSLFGHMQVKGEGQNIKFDDMEQNHKARYTHVVWAKGFLITREMFEDDQYNLIGRQKTRALAHSSKITKETVHANVINRGFDGAYNMGSQHDGQPLFSTAHPLGPKGGTFSNTLAIAADLSEASLEQMIIDIHSAVDARGLQIKLMPQRLCVPKELQFEASRLLDSEFRPGTDLNDINAIRQQRYLPGGFHINHYLTDPDAWFMKTTATRGLICFNRRAIEFANDSAFDSQNGKFAVTERYSQGWSDPRGMYGSAGS